MTQKIQCCIFDWAGTTVDYGCFAPLAVFLDIFARRDIQLSSEEARGPMGLLKRDHISALCALPSVQKQWTTKFGSAPTEQDIDALYADFEPALFSILKEFVNPLPGVLDTMQALGSQGIKIGSTTGYTRQMMEIVQPRAAEQGYSPDACLTPSEVSAGRPAPWMIYRNCEELQIWPLSSVVKFGDTLSDIHEGVNASVWSIGIIEGSSELGLSQGDYEKLTAEEREKACEKVRERFLKAGAHDVLQNIREVPELLDRIESGQLQRKGRIK